MRLLRRSGLAAAGLVAVGSAPALAQATPAVEATTTTGAAERVDTIPIARHVGAKPRVAISLGLRRMSPLREGDGLRALGEVQVTNTCVTPEPRCIGRRYSFAPRVRAWLVIGRSARAIRRRSARRISEREFVECGQRRPNRNHHCVLAMSRSKLTVRSPRRLPCRPSRCHLNLVVSAHHPDARHGNRLVIGADTPNGAVRQSKGRVSALLIPAGSDPRTRTEASRRRVNRTIPMDRSGRGWTSVYSVKLRNLRAGEVITARARQILDIDHLGNAVFDSSQIVLTQGRRKVSPGRIARRSGAPSAFTEANGFNCTQGPSAYRTPCVSRKVGQIRIVRDPVDRRGRSIPLYVNLISRGFLKTAQPKRPSFARVLRGGSLRVNRILEAGADRASD
jgi:hypothetical protein